MDERPKTNVTLDTCNERKTHTHTHLQQVMIELAPEVDNKTNNAAQILVCIFLTKTFCVCVCDNDGYATKQNNDNVRVHGIYRVSRLLWRILVKRAQAIIVQSQRVYVVRVNVSYISLCVLYTTIINTKFLLALAFCFKLQ